MKDIIKDIKGIESPELKDFANIDMYPTIEVPGSLTDLFLLDTIDEEYRNKHTYHF